MKIKLQLVIALLICSAGTYAQTWSTSNGADIYYTAGKVGIGTSTPSQALEVSGTVLSSQTTTTTGTYSSSGSSNLSFNTSTTNRMTILNSNGFVGIGTTSPTQLLHVNGNVLATQFQGTSFAATGSITANTFTANNGTFNSVSSLLALQTNGTNRFVIQSSNGNVGVGTATPDSKFHISGGNLVIDNSSAPTIYTGTGTAELNRYLLLSNSVGQPTASGLKVGGVLVADDYTYASPSKNDLIVKGKLGIGTPLTSNPNNYTLAVNGTIGTKDVHVERTSTTWPDYVFSRSYELQPLKQVAAYIEENKHLEGVPSAADVEKDGHSLAEMDAILLKKVEELTLYIIQQQKEIEALKAQLKNK